MSKRKHQPFRQLFSFSNRFSSHLPQNSPSLGRYRTFQTGSKTVQLTGDALLRQILTKEFGDDSEIDRYIALSHRIGDGTHKGLKTMLEWTRLECKFNWSQDAQDLYNDFAELAENPELVTEFSFR